VCKSIDVYMDVSRVGGQTNAKHSFIFRARLFVVGPNIPSPTFLKASKINVWAKFLHGSPLDFILGDLKINTL
jgi:hypothetical protein